MIDTELNLSHPHLRDIHPDLQLWSIEVKVNEVRSEVGKVDEVEVAAGEVHLIHVGAAQCKKKERGHCVFVLPTLG